MRGPWFSESHGRVIRGITRRNKTQSQAECFWQVARQLFVYCGDAGKTQADAGSCVSVLGIKKSIFTYHGSACLCPRVVWRRRRWRAAGPEYLSCLLDDRLDWSWRWWFICVKGGVFCLSSFDLLLFSSLIAVTEPAASLPWETGRHQPAPELRRRRPPECLYSFSLLYTRGERRPRGRAADDCGIFINTSS